MRIICRAVIAFLLFCSTVSAQTYLGDGTGTSGLGGSCCNWVFKLDASGLSCPSDQVVTHPTCAVISAGQYNAYFTAYFNQYGKKYLSVINNGLAITCTCSGYPYGSLNGTYSLSGADFDKRSLSTLNAQAGGSFPNGSPVIQFADMSGTLHTFDSVHLIELGVAVSNYLARISSQSVGPPQNLGWPANNQATIP